MAAMSLAEVKQHLRVDDDAEDAFITGLIAAAIDHVERSTGLVLERRTVVETITGFGARIRTWPITTVDSVEYVDGSGVDQAILATDYRLRNAVRPARLANIAKPWPPLGRLNGAVTLTMTAGYDDQTEVPAGVWQAIKMIVGHFYDNRAAVVIANAVPVEVPMAVEMLLAPHRLKSV